MLDEALLKCCNEDTNVDYPSRANLSSFYKHIGEILAATHNRLELLHMNEVQLNLKGAIEQLKIGVRRLEDICEFKQHSSNLHLS